MSSPDNVYQSLPPGCTIRILKVHGAKNNDELPDITEREIQVSFMHKIYALAASTFVWLDPEGDDSKLAMEYAASLDAAVYNQELRQLLQSRGDRRQKSFILDMLSNNDEE
ncbi:MAG: hypothetical protein Q9160_007845 [Pyrenula sp. 1 TL-2023]